MTNTGTQMVRYRSVSLKGGSPRVRGRGRVRVRGRGRVRVRGRVRGRV